MNHPDDADVGRADLPVVRSPRVELSNVLDSGFMCENADCDAFGEPVES